MRKGAIGILLVGLFLSVLSIGEMTENVSGATKVDLYAGDVTTSSVKLTWTETEDWAFDQYELYMDDGSGWRLLKTFQSKYTLEYKVTGLESGTVHIFKIRDVDSFGSRDSDTVYVTTEKPSIPSLPGIGVLLTVFGVALVISASRRKKK
ncbi:MAG: fibronectin type III domain-containing protein [Thermoplasmata archaeon]